MNKYIHRGDFYINLDSGVSYMVTDLTTLGYKKEVIIELQTFDYTDIKRISPLELSKTFREAIKTKSPEGHTILN